MQDAIVKALMYAKTAEIKLGKAIQISESSSYTPPTMRSMRYDNAPGGSGSPVPINAGDEAVSVSVNVVFETGTDQKLEK